MEKNCCDHDCTAATANSSVCQTLSEMDWERGIWNAAFSGDMSRLAYLINKAKNVAEFVNTQDNAGYTALHYAARNGHLEICKFLLENGALIDITTKSGKATPLHKASAAGKISTVRYLIESGANLQVKDDDGKTILHKAVEGKHIHLIETLLAACPQLRNMKDNKGLIPSLN
ncbi:ankyrin repeat domain-containing protein 39-like isoform X1 [Leptidea sinapis]|uniref:ankyrin repeat domain-containing protein 39-like isoform X1 n=1 Tax=Leptidea sinapis TaxID=189913 RepID=UPI00211FB687|nr:ankyrin repeat domain-containing protein 39-like isoform X1 [Leptidea sinapis]